MKKLLLILFVLVSNIGYSQNSDEGKNHRYSDAKLDSFDLKIKPLIANKSFYDAASIMLDKGKLLFDYGMYLNSVVVLDNALSVLRTCKDTNNVKHRDLYVECLNLKGLGYSYLCNFDKALECYILMDKYNNGSNDRYAVKVYNGMGIVFAMNNNNEVAEGYYKKALSLAKTIPDFNLFSICSNLGGIFMQKKELDSALIYFLDAYKIAMKHQNVHEEIVSLQSLGMVNARLYKYSLAIRYYNEAYDIAKINDSYSQLPFIKLNLFDCYIALKDYDSALKAAEEALVTSRKTGAKNIEARSLKGLYRVYKAKGDYKRALSYVERSMNLNDSVFSTTSEEKLLRQKSDFETYRIQSEKAMTANELALDMANRKINNMIIFFSISILIVLLAVLIVIVIRQYRINRQLNTKMEDIRVDDESQRFELRDEIEKKSNELTTTSLLIVKFNELSYLLNTKLRILRANLSSRSKEMELVKEMEGIIQQFAPEKSWEQFNHYFEQISPEFYDKLDILYPDLTIGEKRICTLISLNLTSNDIASLIGKSSKAVNMAKWRIRKKMKIDVDENIADVLLRIK